MQNAQKPDHIGLSLLIQRLKDGKFVVPDFQREFEWDPWDIRDLMRSIFLDYYIGSLLLWRGGPASFRDLSCEPLFGGSSAGHPDYIVLDGQQRLTAMNYAFCAPKLPLPRRKTPALYFIRVDKLMVGGQDDAFDYEWDWGTSTALTSDRDYQFREHIFPLATIGRDLWALFEWVQGYGAYWQGAAPHSIHVEGANRFGALLRAVTDNFQISYVELDRDLDLEKVCDIFTQLNSKGVRLDVFDLMNAFMKPKGLQLRQMWRETRDRLSFVDSPKMNVYVLQVMSILRQSYCSPKFLYFLIPGAERPIRAADGTVVKEQLVADTGEFKRDWDLAVAALEGAIARLRHPHEFGVSKAAYLPYVAMLPVFAALCAVMDELAPGERLAATQKFKLWYWASIFTNRYSGSVESTSARDFQDVRAWFGEDVLEPALIADFNNRLVRLDFRTEVKRGAAIYNGIFNLLVMRGARDWVTGNIPQPEELDDHHIVPLAWGKAHSTASINSILNRTAITAATNRHIISDQLPNAYLPELIRRSGREAVEALMASHFISPAALDILLRAPFTSVDFEDFLAERQKTLTVAIQATLVQDRVELAPDLLALDGRLQIVERGIRGLILHATANDPARLPQHVAAKISERLQGEMRRNPAVESEDIRGVVGQLEYADLRELEQIITSDALWECFAEAFGTKPNVTNRFGQLAGLRNGIRHLRTLTDVAVHDGQAGLAWFEGVLSRVAKRA